MRSVDLPQGEMTERAVMLGRCDVHAADQPDAIEHDLELVAVRSRVRPPQRKLKPGSAVMRHAHVAHRPRAHELAQRMQTSQCHDYVIGRSVVNLDPGRGRDRVRRGDDALGRARACEGAIPAPADTVPASNARGYDRVDERG